MLGKLYVINKSSFHIWSYQTEINLEVQLLTYPIKKSDEPV